MGEVYRARDVKLGREVVIKAKGHQADKHYPFAGPGVVSVAPFFAKIIASSFAGSVWLAFFDTSCVAPGCS